MKKILAILLVLTSLSCFTVMSSYAANNFMDSVKGFVITNANGIVDPSEFIYYHDSTLDPTEKFADCVVDGITGWNEGLKRAGLKEYDINKALKNAKYTKEGKRCVENFKKLANNIGKQIKVYNQCLKILNPEDATTLYNWVIGYRKFHPCQKN